ncbi:MAG: hypothetical protein AAF503_15895, partial [Pseudomonadota bacterium]
MVTRREIWGWGRSPRAICKMAEPRDKADLTAMLAEGPMIARGAGRAYGDAALQPQLTLSTRLVGFPRAYRTPVWTKLFWRSISQVSVVHSFD